MSRLVSPTQQKALEILAAGGTITYVRCSGNDLSDTAAISPEGGSMQTISVATVEALRVQGWLVDTEDPGYHWRGSRYIISDKGREVLKNELQFVAGARRQRSLRRAGVSWKTK